MGPIRHRKCIAWTREGRGSSRVGLNAKWQDYEGIKVLHRNCPEWLQERTSELCTVLPAPSTHSLSLGVLPVANSSTALVFHWHGLWLLINWSPTIRIERYSKTNRHSTKHVQLRFLNPPGSGQISASPMNSQHKRIWLRLPPPSPLVHGSPYEHFNYWTIFHIIQCI